MGKLTHIPGRRGLPLIGETVPFMTRQQEWAGARYRKYGPVSRADLLGRQWVVVLGADAFATVMINRDNVFESAPAWTYINGPFLEGALIYLDPDAHFRQRRIRNKAFTRRHLERYLDTVNATVADHLDRWQPSADFHAFPAIRELTLSIAMRTLAGLDLPDDVRRVEIAFDDTLRAATALIRYPVPGLSWWRGLRGRAVLDRILRAHIPDKRANPGSDFFSSLCAASDDDGAYFDDDEVVNHMIAILHATHDTTVSTSTAMMYRFGRHRNWQQRCRDEAAADFAGLGAAEAMPTLDNVIRETMRIDGAVPLLPRYAAADTEIAGHRIPAGTYLVTVPQFNHMMGEYWSAPETFDPDRFGPDRREDKSHKMAWVPFGAGVHKCIGMPLAMLAMYATMHALLRRFEWSVPDGYEVPWNRMAIPVPKDGLPITLKRRAAASPTASETTAPPLHPGAGDAAPRPPM